MPTIRTETDQIVEDVLTERLIRTSPLLTEAYIPLPGAAVQIDRPWSFEEMAALDYSRTPHWVTKQLKAALAAEESPNRPCGRCDHAQGAHGVISSVCPDGKGFFTEEPEEKTYCRYCPNGPNDPCASICRACGTLCFAEVR